MSTELEVYQDQVAKLYIAFFGRAPDASGLNYWVRQLGDGAALTSVAADFARTPEFVSVYGESSAQESISLFYQNTLNRAVDQAGLSYWLEQVDQGVPFHEIANTIVTSVYVGGQTVSETDTALIKNKITVAKYIAIELGLDDPTLLASVLVQVTADPASAVQAQSSAQVALQELQQDQVALLYIALFGRAPDASGYDHWLQAMSDGATLQRVTADFGQAQEFAAVYGGRDVGEAISQFYRNTLNRTVDAGGLAYWQQQVDEGLPFYKVANAIVTAAYRGGDGVGVQDQALVKNKLAVAKYVASVLQLEDFKWLAIAFDGVTADPASVDAAIARLIALIDSDLQSNGPVLDAPVLVDNSGDDTPVTPAPILGTNGPDSLTGTAGDDTIDGLAGNDTITGGAGNDTITGGAGADVLTGGDGFDVFVYSSLEELFAANALVDSITGGNGTDTISMNFTDEYIIAAGDSWTRAHTVEVLAQNVANANNIAITLNADAFTAGIRSVTLAGDTDADGQNLIDVRSQRNPDIGLHLTGSASNDIIVAGFGADIIDAGAGTNAVFGAGVGGDRLTHDAIGSILDVIVEGTDEISLTASQIGVTVTITADNGQVNASNSTAAVVFGGGIGADVLFGGSGNDAITGGGGADEINAGAGHNEITDAGVGEDVITHDAAGSTVDITVTESDNVSLTAREAGATVTIAGTDPTTNRNINASLSSASVTINGTALTTGVGSYVGGTVADTITGGGGDDFLFGMGGVDSLTGGAGNDTFVFNPGDSTSDQTDSITDFGDGADSIGIYDDSGSLTGIDLTSDLSGVSGLADNATSTLTVVQDGSTNTVISITNGSGASLTIDQSNVQLDVTLADDGNRTAVGGDLDDIIRGGNGDDTITGGAGADSLTGGAGDDVFLIDAAAKGKPPPPPHHVSGEVIQGGAGIDIIRFMSTKPNDTLVATADVSVEIIELSDAAGLTTGTATTSIDASSMASSENVSLVGNDGANVLTGNDGNNTIVGGGGNDTIDGRAGSDFLTGGTGSDEFRLNLNVDGVDTITDFEVLADDVILELTSLKDRGGSTVTSLDITNLSFASIDNIDSGTASLNDGEVIIEVQTMNRYGFDSGLAIDLDVATSTSAQIMTQAEAIFSGNNWGGDAESPYVESANEEELLFVFYEAPGKGDTQDAVLIRAKGDGVSDRFSGELTVHTILLNVAADSMSYADFTNTFVIALP